MFDYSSLFFFFFSSRRRHTRLQGDWSSDVCSSDLTTALGRALGLPPLGACFFGSFVADFGDKAVTFALVTSVLHALPRRTAARFPWALREGDRLVPEVGDRKSTRLNSSHLVISYAVF